MTKVKVVTCSEPRTFRWSTTLSDEDLQALLRKRSHWNRGCPLVGLTLKPEPPTQASEVLVSIDSVIIAHLAEDERRVLLPVLATLQEFGLVMACRARVDAVSRGKVAAAIVMLDLPKPEVLLSEVRAMIRGFDHLLEDKIKHLMPASGA